MRLLIKQRVFSWTDSYDVYDENENPKYFIKAEFFSLGHQLHVYDRNNHELGVIRQRLLTLRMLLLLWKVLLERARKWSSLSQS